MTASLDNPAGKRRFLCGRCLPREGSSARHISTGRCGAPFAVLLPNAVLLPAGRPVSRQIIRDMLAGTDYEITEAENGKEALAAIAKERPDLILIACRPKLRDKTSGMSENFTLSPRQLFERGVITPERYLCWLTPRAREQVRWVMASHGHTLAEAHGNAFCVKTPDDGVSYWTCGDFESQGDQ